MVICDVHCGPLTFSSNFDSGNLAFVEQVIKPNEDTKENGYAGSELADYEYKLWTSPDAAGTSYESGNRTWFHFSVKGHITGKTVKFHIMNMNKQNKLYNQGMSPVFKVVPGKNSWRRIKEKPAFEFVESQFILSFMHRFDEVTKHTTTYFAFCYPFSYQECQDSLEKLEVQFRSSMDHPHPSGIYFHRDTLCFSNDGLKVDLITISSMKGITDSEEEHLNNLFPDKTKKRALKFTEKKIFFLTSRVHPGETPSSFVFNGFLEFVLRTGDERAAVLRDMFVFKMVPMLNPDGVKRGHYRTDVFGLNLNRTYLTPDPILQPSIYAIKKLMLYHHFYDEIKPDNRDEMLSRLTSKVNQSQTPSQSEIKKLDYILRKSFTMPNISLTFSKTETSCKKCCDDLVLEKRFSDGVSKTGFYFGKDFDTMKNVIKENCTREVNRTKSETIIGEFCKSDSSCVQSENRSVSPVTCNQQKHPTEGGVSIYVDLHAHASKRGCFMYGNYFETEQNMIDCMLLPKLISMNSSHFDFLACNFSEKNMYHKDKRDGFSKEGSGRVAMFKSMGIVHCYTLECNYNSGRSTNSIANATCDDGRATPPPLPGFPPKYAPEHYEEVGRALAVSILDMYQNNPWSRLPLSEHKSLHGVRDWLLKFLKNSRKKLPRSPNGKTEKLNTDKSNRRKESFAKSSKVTMATNKNASRITVNYFTDLIEKNSKLTYVKKTSEESPISLVPSSRDSNNNMSRVNSVRIKSCFINKNKPIKKKVMALDKVENYSHVGVIKSLKTKSLLKGEINSNRKSCKNKAPGQIDAKKLPLPFVKVSPSKQKSSHSTAEEEKRLVDLQSRKIGAGAPVSLSTKTAKFISKRKCQHQTTEVVTVNVESI